jgi:hypothetical protein
MDVIMGGKNRYFSWERYSECAERKDGRQKEMIGV